MRLNVSESPSEKNTYARWWALIVATYEDAELGHSFFFIQAIQSSVGSLLLHTQARDRSSSKKPLEVKTTEKGQLLFRRK